MSNSKQIRIGITASIQCADSDPIPAEVHFDMPIPDTPAEARVLLDFSPALIDFVRELAAKLYEASHRTVEFGVPAPGAAAPVPRTGP